MQVRYICINDISNKDQICIVFIVNTTPATVSAGRNMGRAERVALAGMDDRIGFSNRATFAWFCSS